MKGFLIGVGVVVGLVVIAALSYMGMLNQSQTSEEKLKFSREILKSKSYRKIRPLSASQFNYLTRWYFVVVRELVNLPNFKEDFEWIAKSVFPHITPQQAKQAVEELLELGLLSRDESGRLIQTNAIIATPDEVLSPSVSEYHRELIKRASESIDLVSREKRDISGVTFRLSRQTAAKIKEMIQNFRRELVEEASRDTKPDAIYQLNLQLFPLTDVTDSEGEN